MNETDFSQRHARQIILPEIGHAGQAKLAASSVLIIGMGGLGNPLSLYLAAAGIGRLILVDDDLVSISNLHRQVIFDHNDIGKPKVTVARQKLLAINPQVKIDAIAAMITPDNAESLVGMADNVADGCDNLKTRYLVNDTCHKMRRPLVAAAVTGFDGQLTTIRSFEGENPCYRCLFPAAEPDTPPGIEEDVFANCSGMGVLGPAAGVMGSLQAVEIIKELLGIGDNMVGKLLIYDALATTMRVIKYQKRAGCRCEHL